MRCPHCNNKLLSVGEDGSSRLRIAGAVTFAEDGTASSKCYWCSKEVPVPLTLKAPAPKEVFVLRRKTPA